MNKPLCVISAAVDTFSGYGAKSRGWIKSLIELKGEEWNIKIIPQRWGNTPWGYIDEHFEKWGFLKKYLLEDNKLSAQPDIWIQDTVANEFQKVGKFNIGFCSGIETTYCSMEWINGCNNMDLIVTSSKHSQFVFKNTVYEKKHNGQTIDHIRTNTPVEVLFEGIDDYIYKKKTKKDFQNKELSTTLDSIKEKFSFLFVGHWLNGDLGEDRKNVGLLIKAFMEVWKDKPNQPALVLKMSAGAVSYMDRENILSRINQIKSSIDSDNLPNVYLLHGNFSEEDMSEIYNHPKIKAMISLTKGEGYGRPLLEFTTTGKPLMVSNWSGHLDFLKKDLNILIKGNLKDVHPSALSDKLIIQGSQWFEVDHGDVGMNMVHLVNNYNDYLPKSKKQAKFTNSNWTEKKMTQRLEEILKEHVKSTPKMVKLSLPTKKLKLPKLQKSE